MIRLSVAFVRGVAFLYQESADFMGLRRLLECFKLGVKDAYYGLTFDHQHLAAVLRK